MNGDNERARGGWVLRLAEQSLERIKAERWALLTVGPETAAGKAARADRLAVLCEREVAWWTVVARWTWRRSGAESRVMRRAAFEAAELRVQAAATWRGVAADWRARAEGRPVCSVIGCGCGGVCEVSA